MDVRNMTCRKAASIVAIGNIADRKFQTRHTYNHVLN